MARLHLAIAGCEDFFAQARSSLNVEDDFSLAILFESPTDGLERIVAMAWFATLSEMGEMGHGEFFLGLRPKEWRAFASPFLQCFVKGCDGFLQPGRPLLAFAEDCKRGAQIGFGKSPIERRAVAGLFRQRTAVGGDRLLQPSRSALARSEGSQRIAKTGLGPGPVERHAVTGGFLQRFANGGDRIS